MREMRVRGVVLRYSELQELLNVLREKELSQQIYFQVILSPTERPLLHPGKEEIYYETHLVPGIVALFQCRALLAQQAAFHPNERFAWEHEGVNVFVTDKGPAPRFVHVELPQRYAVSDIACSCGRKQTFTLV